MDDKNKREDKPVPQQSKAEMTKGVAGVAKANPDVGQTSAGLTTNQPDAPKTPAHTKVPPVHGTPIPGTTVPAACVVEEDESQHTEVVGDSKSGKISSPSDVEPDDEEQLHKDQKKPAVQHTHDTHGKKK